MIQFKNSSHYRFMRTCNDSEVYFLRTIINNGRIGFEWNTIKNMSKFSGREYTFSLFYNIIIDSISDGYNVYMMEDDVVNKIYLNEMMRFL